MIKINKQKIMDKKRKIQKNTKLTITIFLLLIIIITSISAFATIKEPTTEEKKYNVASYSQKGEFSYIAHLKNNTVYNKTKLYPNEGNIFRKITDHINGSFTYTFTSTENTNIQGTYTLIAHLVTNSWTKKYILIPQKTFSSTKQASFTEQFPINYTHYEDIATEIDNETGVNSGEKNLVLKFNIYTNTKINNETIHETLQPSINISLDGNIIEITGDLNLYQTKNIQDTKKNHIPGSITTSIYLGTLSLVFTIILITFFVFTTCKISKKEQTKIQFKKIMKKYGEWIVEIQKQPTAEGIEKIPVQKMDDLVKLSEELSKPIMFYKESNGSKEKYEFYILEEYNQYIFTLK